MKNRAVNKMETSARLDEKGRVMLPKCVRDALKLVPGDTVFLRLEAGAKVVRIARGMSPFDVLAIDAIREYKKGRTRTIEEFAREHDITL